jgi:signal transduction histidine kinase
MDDIKTNLVATVSHELKTPLTSVRMVLHMLLEKTLGPLTSRQQDFLRTACDDAERLLRMLNTLLDLARLEQGNTELQKEETPPAELIRDVIDEMNETVAALGRKLRSGVSDGLPAVSVDRHRIGHVFSNFITNAVKHSPPGAEILVRAIRSEDGGVEFCVADPGPGVSKEYQSRIFDRFFRVPGEEKRGAGLGLSIAREIVLAHGGHIGVRNAPGRGSEFFFVLGADGGAARV